ncbi:hypothetical protein QUR06_000269 [Escherichia coli]|nr:hypothetical protein [Escherichia coli]
MSTTDVVLFILCSFLFAYSLYLQVKVTYLEVTIKEILSTLGGITFTKYIQGKKTGLVQSVDALEIDMWEIKNQIDSNPCKKVTK